MDAFAEEFLERLARHWKPRTLGTNSYVVRQYILPAFGHMMVNAIAAESIKEMFASMSSRPSSANRTMRVLSTTMRVAELWGLRPHNSNPFKNT